MIEVLAALLAGTFFGASIYINLAQHPATLAAGGDFAAKFFPPMYAKASAMQIALALSGTVFGVVSWIAAGNLLWLIGAVFLVSVVPITIYLIKPINDQLNHPSEELSAEAVIGLLQQWNPKHWIRSGVSGVSFFCYLLALAN